MAVNWTKAKTAYVTGEMGYREIAKRFKAAPSEVSKRGKKEGWVQARNEYRLQLAEKSIEASQEMEINRLRSLQNSAMKMCERLETAINDPDELYMHAGVEGIAKGVSKITERRLTSIDDAKARNLCQSLQTLTNAVRNLFEIQTKAQQQQLELAREKMQLEREKAARDAEKNAKDDEFTVTFTPELEELVE